MVECLWEGVRERGEIIVQTREVCTLIASRGDVRKT